MFDSRTTSEVFEGPNSRYRNGARDMSIHPDGRSNPRKKQCKRDLDGAFRWDFRMDGNNPGGLREIEQAAE